MTGFLLPCGSVHAWAAVPQVGLQTVPPKHGRPPATPGFVPQPASRGSSLRAWQMMRQRVMHTPDRLAATRARAVRSFQVQLSGSTTCSSKPSASPCCQQGLEQVAFSTGACCF